MSGTFIFDNYEVPTSNIAYYHHKLIDGGTVKVTVYLKIPDRAIETIMTPEDFAIFRVDLSNSLSNMLSIGGNFLNKSKIISAEFTKSGGIIRMENGDKTTFDASQKMLDRIKISLL